MTESNPNNLEGKQPLTPEDIEALKKRITEQEKANEMLNAMEKGQTQESGVPFDAGPSSKYAEQLGNIVNPENKAPSPAETDESGLDRIEQEKLQRDPKAWIEESIRNPNLAAYQKMAGLIEAHEQEEKREAA